MTSKKSRVVTIEMLNDAARDYTELRRSLEGLAKSVDDAYDRLQVSLREHQLPQSKLTSSGQYIKCTGYPIQT